MADVDITGLDKALVLRALYNRAQAQGMGMLQYKAEPMDADVAEKIVADGHLYFDYLMGRVMKIDIGKDTLDPYLYDRDNGDGAVAEVIASLRETGDPEALTDKGRAATKREAAAVLEDGDQDIQLETAGPVATMDMSGFPPEARDAAGRVLDELKD